MTQKITIDQEIENIKHKLDEIEDTSPYYVGPDLKVVQGYVFTHHAIFERDIDALILLTVKHATSIEQKEWMALLSKIHPLVEKLSFRSKLELLKEYYLSEDDAQKLLVPLEKVNKIRNEWAHSDGETLRAKYSYRSSGGKEKIRDLFRALKYANDVLNNYFQNKVL